MMKAITELGDYGMALLISYYAANVINHQLHLQQQTQAQAQAHQQQTTTATATLSTGPCIPH